MKSNPINQLILTTIIIGVSLVISNIMVATVQQGTSHADTASTSRASVNVSASCTFSGATTTANHAVNITPGSYNDNIGNHNFRIICNDNGGFSVYAIGYSDDQYGNTDMINSDSSQPNIATGLTTSGPNSSWAMKLTPVAGTYTPTISDGINNTEDFTVFHVIPSTFTKVATFLSLTDATAGSQFQATYRIYVDTTQAAGTYTGKVKYTIIHPSSYVAGTYTINYDANGGTGNMGNSTNIYNFEPFALPEASFTAPYGYAFAGWCSVQDQTQSPQTTCPSISYAVGDTIHSPATAGGAITLYAYWQKASPIQDLTLSTCQKNVGTNGNAIGVGDNIVVYDTRDSKSYTVRYINGDCWMTQNLRFTGVSLSPDTSNVAANKTINYYSLDSNNTQNLGDYSGHCDSTNSYNNACIYDSGNTTIGVWYNYYAATAGTISGSPNYNIASQDICPKNWHLPTGSANIHNTDLNRLVGNTTLGQQNATAGLVAFGAVTGGRYFNGSPVLIGNGYWWSDNVSGSTSSYSLSFSSSTGMFNANNSSTRSGGIFVRCVRYNDGYMQDFSLSEAAEGVEYTLKDRRDDKTYTVKKINNQLWMTQNLRFNDTSVSAATSNVSTSRQLTYYSLNSSNAGDLGAYFGKCNSTNGYGNACIYDSGDATTGIWYNYYAATAGTIYGNSNSTSASHDICPRNWRLPTGPNANGGTDFNRLIGNTTSVYQDPTPGLIAFGAVAGGHYSAGLFQGANYGHWWAATAYSGTRRYIMSYGSGSSQYSGQFLGTTNSSREVGYFVRCVRDF